MSTRIATALSLDTAGFQAGITQAEAAANKFAARLRAQGVGMFSGKSAAESARSIGQMLAAQERIAQLEAQSLQRRKEREAADIRQERANMTILGGSGGFEAKAGGRSGGGMFGTIGGVLARTFNPAALFKGLLVGAGIGTALQLITTLWEKVTEKTREAAEEAKRQAEFTERSKAATQALAAFKQTPEEKLASLQGRERVLRRQLQWSLQDSAIREQQPVGPIEAELRENELAQAPIKAALAEAANKKLAGIRENESLLAAEREKRAIMGLSLEQQLERSKERQLRFDDLSAKAKAGSSKRAEYTLMAEEEITKQKELQAEIDQRHAEEWQRELDEFNKSRAQETELIEKRDAAAKRAEDAEQNLRTQKMDALGTTVEGLSRTRSGRRDTSAIGMVAQGILQDEDTARRLHRSSKTVTMWDAKRQAGFEADAEFFQTRALNNRAGLAALTSGERDPFSAASGELNQAAQELKQAAAELKNIEVEISAN